MKKQVTMHLFIHIKTLQVVIIIRLNKTNENQNIVDLLSFTENFLKYTFHVQVSKHCLVQNY